MKTKRIRAGKYEVAAPNADVLYTISKCDMLDEWVVDWAEIGSGRTEFFSAHLTLAEAKQTIKKHAFKA